MTNFSEEQIAEATSGSPQYLEQVYRNLMELKILKGSNRMDELRQYEKMYKEGIQNSYKELEQLKQQAIDEGNNLVSDAVQSASLDFGIDILSMPLKGVGTALQIFKGLGEASIATIFGDNRDAAEGLSETAISAFSKLPFLGGIKTLTLDANRNIEKLREKYTELVQNHIDHMKDLKDKLASVRGEMSYLSLPNDELKQMEEAILKKHPEFKNLDAEIQRALNEKMLNSGKNLRSASANVFTRINELLTQINASLQQLSANLEI